MSAASEAKLGQIENEIVDVKHDVKCWIRGKITNMTTQNGKNMVDIEAEGMLYTQELPSDDQSQNVGKCGTRLKKEGCDENTNSEGDEATAGTVQEQDK